MLHSGHEWREWDKKRVGSGCRVGCLQIEILEKVQCKAFLLHYKQKATPPTLCLEVSTAKYPSSSLTSFAFHVASGQNSATFLPLRESTFLLFPITCSFHLHLNPHWWSLQRPISPNSLFMLIEVFSEIRYVFSTIFFNSF